MFDGDEMNAHIPQSYEASIELEEIAAVPHQIITPRHAKPIIGVVQDTLVGAYRLTRPNNEFSLREYMNLMMWNKRFDGQIEAPRKGTAQAPRWTGHQVVSTIIPPLNIEMENSSYDSNKIPENFVKIREGNVSQGTFDKDIFAKPSKGIIHTTYNDYGPKDTVQMIDTLQNTIEHYLILNGFSVGISDLIADEGTKENMEKIIQERKKEIEDVILQVHLDLFDNNTGKTNQEEFESRVFNILNKATELAGKAGQSSLSEENRMMAMVRAGSKGGTVNIAQMVACLGQTAIDGKRIPYGFTDRTLPHYKKYDDGAEARGFVESSFIRGLTPQEFFFHAMSGREGLIDTAVKSVTADTSIIVMENGNTKYVRIGDWIDSHIDGALPEKVQHFDQANMELLELQNEVYIPTCDMDGIVSWGKMSAVTRHDPGDKLYKITTQAGKEVTITKANSLIVWNDALCRFEDKLTADVKIGDCVPVTMNLVEPPTITTHIDMTQYFPKSEYVYGTDFKVACDEMAAAMEGRQKIPAGWWENNNGTTFTLPYPNKARFQRVNSGRSDVDHIAPGIIYPYSARRNDIRLPEKFELNERNGIFIGLFLADGNVDFESGYVQITKNNDAVREFVKQWFADMGIEYNERSRNNAVGVSSDIRGYSRLLAQFLDKLVGHGSENKYVPDVAFTAPLDFVKGLLNGYFSGDGSVGNNAIEVSSASPRLIEGIAMLCSRLGIFAYTSVFQMKSNNFGTTHILPTNTLTIRSKWAGIFAEKITLMHPEKQEKLSNLTHSKEHINYKSHNDIVLDTIVKIEDVDPAMHPKMYDVTVPSTFNFAIASGLNLKDTAETGYIQRQLVKGMEDVIMQHDGTVRDGNMNIMQFHYGEDGINATKIENQSLPLGKLSVADIRREFSMEGDDSVEKADPNLMEDYIQAVLADRKLLVEKVFASGPQGGVQSPVNLDRLILNFKIRYGLTEDSATDLTPTHVINGIARVCEKTQPYNKIWCALLRFHLAPHRIILKLRFTRAAFDAMCDTLIIKNMQGWAQPGELVGIVAAQSIGEPSTQMSSVKSTVINIKKMSGGNFYGTIGEFIDTLMEENKSRVIPLGGDSTVLDLDTSAYQIVGVSEDERVSWKGISQVSRHPANGGLVKVTTQSGRTTTATLSHSFLRRNKAGIVPVLGSDLREGMRIPIARVIPEVPNPLTSVTHGSETYMLDKEFGWLCGIYLADGSLQGNKVIITKIAPIVEEKLRNICDKYSWELSIRMKKGEYGPSKDNIIHSANLKNFMDETFKSGSYNKRVGGLVFNSNKEFIAGLLSGYFDGDGNVNAQRQMIRASSRNKELIHDIARLFGFVGIFCTLGEEKSVNFPDKVQYTLILTKKYASLYKDAIGFNLEEKVLALDEIIGYESRDDKHDVKQNIDMIPELGDVIADVGKALNLPGHSRNYGRWRKKEAIGRETLAKYYDIFVEEFTQQGAADETVRDNLAVLKSALDADVVWDKITGLEYLDDPKEYVYDFTVPGNDSFMVDCNVLVHNTLNTFHLAGVAAKSNVTRGVPRLKELLKVTHNPKATSLTVYLKPEYREMKEKAREVAQDLELTLLRDITFETAIYYEPSDNSTIIEEDKDLLEFYKLFESAAEEDSGMQEKPKTWSPWILRIELNREKMFNKNITMDDIAFVLRDRFPNVNMVYSDYNSNKLIMRIRFFKEDGEDIQALKKFQNRVLNGIVIRGVTGIKGVTFRLDKDKVVDVNGEYKAIEQYVLDTDGSNFLEVANHPAVDANRLYSTNVHDLYEQLGVEAARAGLLQEITGLFDEVGVNQRHLGLLCDIMTRPGKFVSMDRYGINKLDIGPLAKASFEETEKILLKASVFGEVDPVVGVSANILTGQPIRGGTNFTQILLDEQALPRLLQGLPPMPSIDEEDDGLDTYELEKELEDDVNDPCGISKFQVMRMAMPDARTTIEEDDVELVIV